MLYVKWRMARMQRERRVLNYDQRKGGKVRRERDRNGRGGQGNRNRRNGSGERTAEGVDPDRAGNDSETANFDG